MSELCPFLRAAGSEYGCASASEEELAFIPGGFLQRTCLTPQFEPCPRYQAAAGAAAAPPGEERVGMVARAAAALQAPGGGRWLAIAGGAAALLAVACMAFVVVAALLTGGFGLARSQSAVYVEPSATFTAVPTFTPTAIPATPTLPATNTPEPTATSVVTPTAAISLTVAPALPPTDTATAEPIPTDTEQPPAPTRRPPNTATPRPTNTRPPTATPTATPLGCNGDERMVFVPAAPGVCEPVAIQVRSKRAHSDVSLTGPVAPTWVGVTREGDTYVWNWSAVFPAADTYAYSFKVNGGSLVCMADIPVSVATSPMLTLIGPDHLDVGPGGEAEIRVRLTNTTNAIEGFDFGLQGVSLPGGWQAKYCLDGVGCWDYTLPSQAVENVAICGTAGLSIKLIAPLDALPGSSASATLWVQSRHGARMEQAGSATVITP